MVVKILLAFLKIGVIGFGSGPAMLVLIEREMLDLDLMTARQFADAVALSTGLPGPLATKMALYCGYQSAGLPGAAAALFGLLLPSTIGILILARFVMAFRDQPRVAAALRALKPVVVAIFLFLAINSGRNLAPRWDVFLLGAAALALLLLRVEPWVVILGAITLGLIVY